MNPEAYLEMDAIEAQHWWFTGRRAILSKYINSLDLAQHSRILEVGCGTGGNLKMLSDYGTVSALEMDAHACEIANRKNDEQFDIRPGFCPDEIPFADQRFDLICLFDVLEHIEQDTETLLALRSRLSESGRILITVPAYQWLWGPHDEHLHHKRRYTAARLREVIETAQMTPKKMTYFNTLLFPLAVLARLKDNLLPGRSATGSGVPPSFVNNIFQFLFGMERFLLPSFNLPFGVSLLCILEEKSAR